MAIRNLDVRNLIKEKRLHYYEVAEAMNISNTYFSILLQRELSPEKKQEVMDAINRIGG